MSRDDAARDAVRILYRKCIHNKGSSFNKTKAECIITEAYADEIQAYRSLLDIQHDELTAERQVREKLVEALEKSFTRLSYELGDGGNPETWSNVIGFVHAALAEAEKLEQTYA